MKKITAFEYAGCPYCVQGKRLSLISSSRIQSTAKSRLNGLRRMNILRSSQTTITMLHLRCSSMVRRNMRLIYLKATRSAEVTSRMCWMRHCGNNGFMLYSTNFSSRKNSNLFMKLLFCLYNFYKEVIKVKPPNITPVALGMMRIQSFLGSFVQP